METKAELKKQLDNQKKVNNIAVAENYQLGEEVKRLNLDLNYKNYDFEKSELANQKLKIIMSEKDSMIDRLLAIISGKQVNSKSDYKFTNDTHF